MSEYEFGQIAVFALAAVAFAGAVFALTFPHLSGEVANEKRRSRVTESHGRRTARIAHVEQTASRRKAVADTLKELEDRAQAKEKLTLGLRLERAGLDITANTFWVLSIASGVGTAIGLYFAVPNMHYVGIAVGAFVGTFGLPRWVLSFLTKSRQSKFTNEFANAIDIIVRGIKSGLPLNECLGIIARESPEPVRSEFRDVVEQQRVGVPLSECFERMISRMPLSEVKFFGIVVAIQQQAGGNLSEALENLAGVLRDRKTLAAKVQALSAEAKASAMVLGALPFCVAGMVYFSTPDYISLLWQKRYGQMMLLGSAIWMVMGIMVMKKMINFKY